MASQKFRDLVHYTIWKCKDPTQLGATKLNKIPWYVDTIAYRMTGLSLTGEVYVKRQNGPVPKNILYVLRVLEDENKVVIREPSADFEPREFVARVEPDMSAFDSGQMQLIDFVIDEICKNHTATSISLSTHDHVWEAANLGEVIPFQAVLVNEVAELDDEDITWADAAVSRVLERQAAADEAASG